MKSLKLVALKTLKFLRVNRIAARFYYKYVHGFNSAGKELPGVIEKCFDQAVEFGTTELGDYCEFGIFKGHTFAYAVNYGKKLNLEKMRYFGFDSFQGLPEIHGLDETEDMPFYKGQYSAGKEQVMRDMNSTHVDWSRIELIEGFFDVSLTEETSDRVGLKQVAVALIDCDLYASTVSVLDFIEDMLLDRTILIFDDWNTFNSDNERGQRKAFAEFLERHPEISAEDYFSYGLWGKVFIIRIGE